LLCGVLACVVFAAAAVFKGTVLGRPAADPAPTRMDPTKVMGPKACIDCHKPEIAAWQASRHAVNFEKTLSSDKAKDFAAKLGVTAANISREGLCVDCHGQKAQGTSIPPPSITGVSCECCHGASGGENGWLNPHGSYGAKGLVRAQETPEHKIMRHEAVDMAGMVRPARMYALAKNCLGCHAVPNEDLQNKTDHPKGSANFELASWVAGDVAHNLFLDPKKNADAPSLWMDETGRTPAQRKRLLYVFGRMADLEVSLRYLAAAAEDDAYAQAMAGRAKAAGGNLDDIADLVPELKPVLAEFKKIKLKLKPANKDVLLPVADKVAAAALEVEKNQDGSKLDALDDVIAKVGNGPRYDPTK
jgi:hypothetical protein